MNREIKFRVWDKELKEMVPPKKVMCGQLGILIDTDKEWTDVSYLMDRFKAMQFTGLKDKNGKEIYEGDIVTNNLTKKVVEYSTPRGGWILKRGEGSFTDLVKYESECIYIIGNIYENPELLK